MLMKVKITLQLLNYIRADVELLFLVEIGHVSVNWA